MPTDAVDKVPSRRRWVWFFVALFIAMSTGQTACTRDEVAAALATVAVDLEATLQPWGATAIADVQSLGTRVPSLLSTSKAVAPAPSTTSTESVDSPPVQPNLPSPTETPAPAPTSIATATTVPTSTPTVTYTPAPTQTATPSPTPTATPYLATIQVIGGSMILIPGSVFQMGATADSLAEECALFREGCQSDWFSASEPVHTVLLDGYYLDAHEVTNNAYAEFLNQSGDQACQEQLCLDPEHTDVFFENDVYLVPDELAQNPATGITWFGAMAFCEWREARLPTEAEWEKAAAWDEDGSNARRYPWGDDFDGQIVNFCDAACQEPQANAEFNDGFAESAPVASFGEGRSAAGVYDMAGNVWEWVADWYDATYYQVSTQENPIGPAAGEDKVVRGGSWFDTGNFSASAIRFPSAPENADRTIGFRCAANLP